MKRIRLAIAIAVLGGVISVGGAADARARTDCLDAETWKSCGEHVRASRLPMRFAINLGAKPASVSSGDATAALNAAADAWNVIWPRAAAGCRALCSSGSTTRGFGSDGQNTVLWGDPGRCDRAHANAIATACIWYESGDERRIREVDVILNSAVAWRQPTIDADIVTGEAFGAVPPPFPLGEQWYDLQSVLTHELGHALGLEDVGSAVAAFYTDLRDATRYTQTMYRWYYPRTTSKRTLDHGDVAGASYAALASTLDP